MRPYAFYCTYGKYEFLLKFEKNSIAPFSLNVMREHFGPHHKFLQLIFQAGIILLFSLDEIKNSLSSKGYIFIKICKSTLIIVCILFV